MIRTALFALVSAATFGTASAALAAPLDGDANMVPGAAVQRSDIERSYAGPSRHAAPSAARDHTFFDRHSQVD